MSTTAIPSSYIIDGDKILISDSSFNITNKNSNKNTNKASYETSHKQKSNDAIIRPAKFFLPASHPILPPINNIQYQVNGIVRLNADETSDTASLTASQEKSVNDFAMTKEFAIKLGIIQELAHKTTSDDKQNKKVYPVYIDSSGNHFRFVSFRGFLTTASASLLNRLSQAIQRLRWHAEHHYCCQCGGNTKAHEVFPAMVCTSCGYTQYT